MLTTYIKLISIVIIVTILQLILSKAIELALIPSLNCIHKVARYYPKHTCAEHTFWKQFLKTSIFLFKTLQYRAIDYPSFYWWATEASCRKAKYAKLSWSCALSHFYSVWVKQRKQSLFEPERVLIFANYLMLRAV